MKKVIVLFILFFVSITETIEKPLSHGLKIDFSSDDKLFFSIKQLQLKSSNSATMDKKFKNYSLINRNKISLKNPEITTLDFTFQLPDGRTFKSDLKRLKITAEGSKCIIQSACKVLVKELEVSPIYTGKIEGYFQSNIFLMNSKDYFVCIVKIDDNESYIAEPVIEDCGIVNPSKLVFYRTSDVNKTNSYKCLVDDKSSLQNYKRALGTNSGCYELDIAQAADYSMWRKYGGNQGVIDRMAAIVGLSQSNFENSFLSQIFLRISGVWLSACEACDPWNATHVIADLTGQFRDWTFQDDNFSNINHDVGQLWSDREFDYYVGWTMIRSICVLNAVQVIRDYTTDLDYQRCTVSHELGHNFGANHDDEGIMIPSATHSSKWSQKSKDEINPYIQELIYNKCLFPCTQGHFEFAKVADEGFRNSDFYEFVDKAEFFECEPVWFYLSFNQVVPNFELKFRTELIYPNGIVEKESNREFGVDSINKKWIRLNRFRLGLVTGNYKWKIYQIASNGVEYLMEIIEFKVKQTPLYRTCSEFLYLSFNETLYDFSRSDNSPIEKNGNVVYGEDRFGNCNYAIELLNGNYLELKSINERAISFWFKLAKQEQMVIYDGGPGGKSYKNWNVGIYKPEGLGQMTNFDTTYGLYFDIGSLGIAVPFDKIKEGWHFVAVSRDFSHSNNFRIMIDGQFPVGFIYDGRDTIENWLKFDQQPFSFPTEALGVPNLHDKFYKTYIGADTQGEKIWSKGQFFFEGWLDEFHVYGKLLGQNDMEGLYNLKNPSPIEAYIAKTQHSCNSGSLTVIATGSVLNFRYKWSNNDTTKTVNNLSPGQYSCTISALVGSCYQSKVLYASITKLPNPTISVVYINPSCMNQTNGSAWITADLPEPLNYVWSNNQTGQNLKNVASGTYMVTVSKNVECSSVTTILIPELETPSIFVDSISHTCLGNSTGTAIINASNGKPPYFYYWSHGLNSRILTNASVGKYIANVGDANYCINSQEIMINEIPKCTAAFTYSIKGDTALFSNNSTNENQSVWDFGDQQLSFLKNPKYIYKKSGIYKVCLTVTNQCNASKYCQEININLMVNFIELPENYVWSISPNPSNEIIQIDLRRIPYKVQSIDIFSSLGALVGNINFPDHASIQSFNCESISSGIYYVKIITDHGNSMRRLVVSE